MRGGSLVNIEKRMADIVLADYRIDFGKYPKQKYEIYIRRLNVYSITTTCRSPEECLNIMIDRAKEYDMIGKRIRIFRTMNGERKLIYDENKSGILQNNLDVRKEAGGIEREVW